MFLEIPAIDRGTAEAGPPHWNLEKVIGAALIDHEFCASLLHSPRATVAALGLTEEEATVLSSAGATSLEDLAAHVHAWVTRAPRPRRATTPRGGLYSWPRALAV